MSANNPYTRIPGPAPGSRPKLENIQALRGVACLLVLLFHMAELEQLFGLRFSPLWPFFKVGYAGVDLFFVLSGFVIAFAHRDRLGTPSAVPGFLARRVWRVYPTYTVVLVLTVTVGYVAEGVRPLAPSHADEFWRAVALLPSPSGHQPWIAQAWSLSYELAFYFAFAAALALPTRLATGLFMVWFTAVLVVIGWDWQPGMYARLLLGPFVLEFLLGVFLGLGIGSGRGVVGSLGLGAGGLVVGMIAASAFGFDLSMQQTVRVIVFGVPSACLVYAAAAADLRGDPRLPLWLRAVGEASYPIYLSHTLAIYLVFAVWIVLGLGQSGILHLLWIVVTVGCGVGGGCLIHRAVERPLLNLGRVCLSIPEFELRSQTPIAIPA